MAGTIETYCIECDEPVTAQLVERGETLPVKGEDVAYTATVAVCPHCGETIADARVESGNIDAAYAAYCKAHGLVTKDEVRNLRQCLGLSLREFSRFLGFGEQTAAKYDKGSVPDLLHSNTMRMAATPKGAEMLLSLNSQSIAPASAAKVRSYIERLAAGDKMGLLWDGIVLMSSCEPCSTNGYRAFDWERVTALTMRLAEKCRGLYKTKLQKAAFFCDGFAFELTGKSLTGMSYAHANYGPIMADYETRIAGMVREGSIRFESYEWGDIIVPNGEAPDVFMQEELEIIDRVAEFVNTFSSASELSEFSHKLGAWKNTSNGELISYVSGTNEIGTAIAERMSGRRRQQGLSR